MSVLSPGLTSHQLISQWENGLGLVSFERPKTKEKKIKLPTLRLIVLRLVHYTTPAAKFVRKFVEPQGAKWTANSVNPV